MPEFNRILAVVDPTQETQPAVSRARWLAERTGAQLELFICDYDQHLAGQRFFDAASLEKARAKLLNEHRTTLSQLADEIDQSKIAVKFDARWDYPISDGITRKASESHADLVVKETHYHPILKRSLFSNTDWSLIRDCPAPLLLVKPRTIAERPRYIAAVDPVHDRDKPAALDRLILEVASKLAASTNGQIEVFHAFDPSPAYAVSADSIAFPITTPVNELVETFRQKHTEALDTLLGSVPDIDRKHVHLMQGETREALLGLADQLNADFVVIGAVSRSVLQRLILGSTAEQLLDHLPCDIVVVKSPDLMAAG